MLLSSRWQYSRRCNSSAPVTAVAALSMLLLLPLLLPLLSQDSLVVDAFPVRWFAGDGGGGGTVPKTPRRSGRGSRQRTTGWTGMQTTRRTSSNAALFFLPESGTDQTSSMDAETSFTHIRDCYCSNENCYYPTRRAAAATNTNSAVCPTGPCRRCRCRRSRLRSRLFALNANDTGNNIDEYSRSIGTEEETTASPLLDASATKESRESPPNDAYSAVTGSSCDPETAVTKNESVDANRERGGTFIVSKSSRASSQRKKSGSGVGGYDPSEGIDTGNEKLNVGDPQQVKVLEKEFSVTSILKELAAIQQQGPQKYCILGTRHCSYLHQQIIELL
jgi:hypothetical protein